MTCDPGPVSGACFGLADSPWFRPFPPSAPQELPFPCSPTSPVLWPDPTASIRSSSIQSISFLQRPRHDCRGRLKPSRVPAWGVRASLDSSTPQSPAVPHHRGPASVAFGHDKDLGTPDAAFSVLNRPGHTHRYRRFTCPLADARARLAVKVVVNLSFLPDLHRLPQRQLARRSVISPRTGIDPSLGIILNN